MLDWMPRKGMAYVASQNDLGPVSVEIGTDADDLGRCHFTMLWMQDCDADVVAGLPAGVRQRAQCFFTQPPLPLEVGNVVA